MQTQLKKIYTLLASGSALKTLLNGSIYDTKIYHSLQNSFEKFPCVTYDIVSSNFRTVPIKSQDITLEINIYSKKDHQNVEDIFTEINLLMNYYKNTTQDIVYIRHSYETDLDETDRKLFRKVVRYQIWAKN